MFIGRRKRHPGGHPGDAWIERSRRAQLLREAIEMRDSGAMTQEEFASLTSQLLAGRPVVEAPDSAPKAGDTRG
jgi:hypothetical protein